jgi:hypothetical protein
MSVPTPTRQASRCRPQAAGAVLFGLALAACAAAPATPPGAATAAPTLSTSTTAGANPRSPSALATPSTSGTPPAIAATTPSQVPPSPSLAALTMLWQGSGPVTDKSSTVATAVDPATGDLWVAVPFENRYWIFTSAGKYLESWGTAGTGDGQFDFGDHAQTPDGFGAIAFAPDGSFYVGDTGNHRIEAFDKNRHFVRMWGSFGTGDGQFSQITSLATDGKTVYVGDCDRYDIQSFDHTGTFIRSFGAVSGFCYVALDPTGGIHATNPQNPMGVPNTMAVFAPDGTARLQTDLSTWGGRPFALSVDAAGMTYVSPELADFPFTGISIIEIDPSGRVTRAWGGGGDAITVTPAGDAVYVTSGMQLIPGGIWTYVRKYAIPKP